MLNDKNTEIFRNSGIDDSRFFIRFGLGEISFDGLRILDLGCAHGSLCLYMASRKAARVVGVDLNDSYIEFAKKNLEINYSKLKQKVTFYNNDISALADEEFDLIVSKDTFEHVSNPEFVLSEMEKRLAPKGRILLGFGPFYKSPYGDHGYLQMPRIPWMHLFFTDRYMINRLNNKGRSIVVIEELGLNRLKVSQFKKLFKNASCLDMVYFKTNVCTKTRRLLVRIFSGLNRIPGLCDYFTYNIYCILQKR
jgi:SAM-dependent methyltransferase